MRERKYERIRFTGLLASLLILAACNTDNTQPDNVPPNVSLGPDSTIFSTRYTLTATASDNVGVTKVEFYQGSSKLGEVTAAPYEWKLTFQQTDTGTRTYTAKAFDKAGNSKESSPQTLTLDIIPDENGTYTDGKDITLPGVQGGPDAVTKGAWWKNGSGSQVKDWPLIAIHAAVLPNGKVLTWGPGPKTWDYPGNRPVNGGNRSDTDLWDPATDTHQKIENNTTELFCAGNSFLPDGRLLVTGGHAGQIGGLAYGVTDVNVFDYTNNTWTKLPSDLKVPRWYPTNLTLGNGETLVVGGLDGAERRSNPEIRDVNGAFKAELTGAFTGEQIAVDGYYPWLFLAPGGEAVYAGPQRFPYILRNPSSGSATWSGSGRPTYAESWRFTGVAVQYRVDKVLITGGADSNDTSDAAPAPVNTSVELPIGNLSVDPQPQPKSSMQFARRHAYGTILPNGQVLVTGGTSGAGFNNEASAVLTPELWNPDTDAWTQMADMQTPRAYHSVALLLPDGRILSAGGGRRCTLYEEVNGEQRAIPSSCAVDHLSAELFYPPYLFKSDGQLAGRPFIARYPQRVRYNTPYTIGVNGDAAKVTWIKLSSVTHGNNQDQRFLELNFRKIGDGQRLVVTFPKDGNVSPPGHYMIFVLDANGVPSQGRIIHIASDNP